MSTSLADKWRKERGGSSKKLPEGDDAKSASVVRPWELNGDSSVKSQKDGRSSVPASDAILRRVMEVEDDGADLGAAAKTLSRSFERYCLTFRRKVVVKLWDDSAAGRRTFDALPETLVMPRVRGVIVTVMVGGRTLVKLEDGSQVLATIGKDCVPLRWWHRLSDWWARP